MKNLSRFCPEIFKSRLACAFLIAQLVFSAFIFDWNKLFLYIEENNEKRCHSVASEAAPSFGGYHTDDSIKCR